MHRCVGGHMYYSHTHDTRTCPVQSSPSPGSVPVQACAAGGAVKPPPPPESRPDSPDSHGGSHAETAGEGPRGLRLTTQHHLGGGGMGSPPPPQTPQKER